MKVLRFIDCMLLWNYIFAAGHALRGRQIDIRWWKAQATVHQGSGVLSAGEKGPTPLAITYVPLLSQAT